jgi:hypothetical protein
MMIPSYFWSIHNYTVLISQLYMVTIHDYVYAKLLFKFMTLFKLICYYLNSEFLQCIPTHSMG